MTLGLERLQARLARAEGRRDAMASRGALLEREIALAKGRLALKPDVEAAIERLQAEASRRNVASFEALLTALVQEVLPGEKPVALELSTERGLPALDVGLARPDGSREDVLEDNGGALTNVVGMALRLIAVVKAGGGRFLALDEADCWIAPDRVPAFFRVLEDGAARLGVQCLAISHHDVQRFAGRMRVSRVDGDPASGVAIACDEAAPVWNEAAPGFRFVRLVDVQGFADATLALCPGVNALVGPNNRGKSTFVRALRAVFYGEARDSLVRAGSPAATVEIGLAHGRTLRFSRRPRRNPVNLWSLHEAGGAVVEEAGTRFESGGRTVPDWVDRMFGMAKVEGLDLHIAHQKFPVFLLGESPSRRAAVLSIGQEAGYLREMLAIQRERCVRDMALVRQGERELAELRHALLAFAALTVIADEIAAARALAAAIEMSAARLDACTRHARALASARRGVEQARVKAAALADVPETAALEACTARLAAGRERERVAARVLAAAQALAAARGRQAALAGLPGAAPEIAELRFGIETKARLGALAAGLDAARSRLVQADAGLEAARLEIQSLLEEAGGLCPACGGAVEVADLLDGHTHLEPEAPRAEAA